ncbi:protein Shroom1 isoform X1 [Harpia harpyja]|uniref:protein Shroom1 isoform X1 n=1 Tax=Harpia harpyja TaxID=202280 RepID=UPI0022B182EF|nr:protein Shroom1 isoform X1 [Harpia harpyja]XP_052627936.1 protein Shroom1 isoform X1 [Harpia harpyja]XP_052627937.1 protein Shroom1 isoform X1 [Harpia harpyja]
MASSGNEIEGWTHRQGGRTGELVDTVPSPENGNRLSPVKSMGSVDHLLHLPGRVDSAYSSFSGGSNVPEYPTPSCYGENCCLPPEQVPYMDSEYVRGIYNLSAANSDLRCLHPYKAPELSIHNNCHSTSLVECRGSTPTRGTLDQGPPPLAAPPPSPPTRLDSYKVTRHLENSRGRCNSGSHSECSVHPAPCVQDNQLADRDISRTQHRGEVTEQDRVAARGKTLENKGLSSDSTNEVSISKIQGLKMDENGEWNPSQQPLKRRNPHIFSRPSSFIFQEYLKTDSVADVPKILSAYNSVHAYKISEEMNSKSYHSVHTNPNTVNDTQENKQYPCSVRKPTFREADLQSAVPEPSQRKGSLPCAQCPLHAELHSDVDQDVFEDSCDLKYMENALLIKNAPRKLNSCTEENQCYDSEGKIGSDVREPLLNQQAKMQRSSPSCSYDTVEAEHPCCEESSDQANKQCYDNTSQTSFFGPKEDSTSQFLHEVKKEKQASNSNPDLSMHLEQKEPPVPYQIYQPKFQKQLLRQLQDDLAGEQITRQMTPMLYYLSGGKTTNILHHNKLAQCQEGSRSSPKELPASSYSASARCVEIERESNQLQRTSHHHQCSADDLLLETEDLSVRCPALSMDESFKNDYREKLKVAQKKVLRETSFKRKDLQMSLPVRLRQKPSKRPSIEHLRSFSLSSASEDAKPVPCSPPHLESLESFSRDEEIKRPQTGRIGGRKRVTKEQKKMCYSEPEKLDQLADKEVSWSQVRDEITEQDTVAARRKTLENRGRALSSSSISRTELKQIQHTALIEYMERKINQRPSSSQHLPLHKPPLQKRLSHPKWPPGKISNPNGIRTMQNNEVFCQAFSKEKLPDVSSPLAFVPPLSVTSRCDPSSAAAGTATLKHDPSPNEVDDRSCTGKCASSESLPQAGDPASGRARERSKSTPSSTQDTYRCAGGAAAPSRRWESCLGTPSFCDPEKDGCENHEYKDNDVIGRACCQDTKELTPETSIPIPRSGSKEDAHMEQECRTKSLNGNALIQCPEQQPAAPQEQVTYCQTALAQPHQGDKNTAKGLVAKETSVHNSQHDILSERETNLPKRRLPSPEDQRYKELAMEIIAKDNSLVDILMPHPVRKTALDLMEGLFPVNISMLDKSHRKKGDVQHVQENDRKSSRDATEECPESKHDAKQRSEGPTSKGNQVLNRSRDSTNDLDDITSKKLELISSLQSKLQTLCEEKELILSEARECAKRGEELEAMVRDVCKPNEFERYMMFIGDLEKVVSLLLCLSSRLARVQNAMRRIDGNTDAEEKQSLNERHKLLSRQREDAKDLKENLDRRERVVSGILAKYLTDQQLQDYQRFVQVKTSLLIEQKDLEEQIKFFKEQLENLEKSIPL